MNELALFAGAGGGILGGKLLGWRTVCAVEIEPYCQRILMQRQDDGILEPFPVWGDIKTFNGKLWAGKVDIITAGFPCQSFSSAARGRLVAENMWPEVIRVANEVQPKYVFCENVPHSELPGLELSAADLGAPHIRKRHWAIGNTDSDREPILALDGQASRLQEIGKDIWEIDPRDMGMVNGVAHRMDRLRAAGNGQIPIVAATAWRILK